MTERRPGRPKAQQRNISSESIIAKAIAILDEKGIEQLTIRLIAKEMSITPMALYHYFTDKNALIKAIGNTLYRSINVTDVAGTFPKIESLLCQYREKVIQYPQITLAIFNASALFPDQATRITNELIQLLTQFGLSAQQATQRGHILIDYTHGEALATSTQLHNEHHTDEKICNAKENYTEALRIMLKNIDRP